MAVDNALLALSDNDYTIADPQEYVTAFIQALSVSLGSDIKSDIQVDVMGVDMEKGLLSVRVTEKPEDSIGMIGAVSCERTVVLDRQTDGTEL